VRSAHSTVMAILADHGIPGIALAAFLAGWVVRSLWLLREMEHRGLPHDLSHFTAFIGASLTAVAVSGLFVNLLKGEVTVWLLALLAATRAVGQQSVIRGLSPDRLDRVEFTARR
jgi:hypothetical protein